MFLQFFKISIGDFLCCYKPISPTIVTDLVLNILQDERKCSYLEWVDQEWPQSLKMCLAKLWSMYEEENRRRLRETVVNAEEYLKMRDKKRKVQNELRFFKSNFAKMVLAKEEALSQLARAKWVLTETKAEVDKTSLDDLDQGNEYIVLMKLNQLYVVLCCFHVATVL